MQLDHLVATEDGQKRIDEIEVGDKVWAYNIFTGETELKEVLTVYVHYDETEILHLHTTAGDVDTTTNHPFYVLSRGWVAAGDLKEGDEVYLIDGSTAFVTGAELERFTEPVTVYNLEVADLHTYFVGDTSILVHNQYDENGNPLSRKQQKQMEDLRNGTDVSVSTVNEARELLHNMPEVSPHPLGRMDPTFPDQKGTYRGDLINIFDAAADYIHDPDLVQKNPKHSIYPHYNIYFPNGEKAAILITGD